MSRDNRQTWGHRHDEWTGKELEGTKSNRFGFLGVEGPNKVIATVFGAIGLMACLGYFFS